MGFLSVSFFLTVLSMVNNFWELLIVNSLYSFFLASTVSIPIVLLFRNVRKTRWEEGVGKFNKIGGWSWVIGLLLGCELLLAHARSFVRVHRDYPHSHRPVHTATTPYPPGIGGYFTPALTGCPALRLLPSRRYIVYLQSI